MRIGIIGPSGSVQTVLAEAATADLPVVCVPLVYQGYTDSLRLVEESRDIVDAFLFTGASPYYYSLESMLPGDQWAFLPRSVNSLLCAMLKAVYTEGDDIRRISMDSYDEELLRLAYAEIGLAKKDVVILSKAFQPSMPDYVANLVDFHLDNFRNRRVDFCLTGLQGVFDGVRAAKQPVTKVFATSEIIVRELQKMYLQHKPENGGGNRCAVLSVQVVFSRERSLYGKSDLQFYRNKAKAMDEVYAFAQSIGASVEAEGSESCRLYAMEHHLDSASKQYSELSLLRELQKLDEVVFVAIGVGTGQLHAEAKYNADLGRERALNARRSCFFIVHDKHRITGPFVDVARRRQNIVVDKGLNKVSEKTGIGLNKLHQIERVLRLNGLETVTASELANLCNLSLCTVNRLLAKLEKNGFARVVGKKTSHPLGRPSRLLQLLF